MKNKKKLTDSTYAECCAERFVELSALFVGT